MILSVIIPVADDSRNTYLKSLLSALEQQTLSDFEVVLVVGDHRQGRAINRGVGVAKGKWIITLDDDTVISDPRLFEKLIAEMSASPEIGMGGAACVIPDWASAFQKRAMRQIPRRFFPEQKKTVDSDFVQHPCLIMPREFFIEIGGEDEELIRGLDPVLRKKVRDQGRRVCIIADTSVAHLLPDSFTALCRMYRRNGQGSAFARRFYPERVLELTSGHDDGEFVERRPLIFRILRRVGFLFGSVIRFHWIRLATDLAYAWGWLAGTCSSASSPDAGVPRYQEDASEDRGHYRLRRLRVTEKINSVDGQIARLHISSDPAFVLGDIDDEALNFFTDKVAVFRRYAGDGILVETDDNGEVLGFLLLLLSPGEFRRSLLRNGYGFRYLASVLSGRYRGSPEGWKKWLRLPLAFLASRRKKGYADSAKIIAFVVREDQRGKGIGTRLLQRAETLAKSNGCKHLEITVNLENEGAKRLYERTGFEVAGEVLESTGRSALLVKVLEES